MDFIKNYPALVSCFTALIVFGLGYFFNWLKGRINKKQELSIIKQIFHDWLESSVKTIESQIKYLKDFIVKLEDLNDFTPPNLIINASLLEKLDEFKLKDLMHIFSINTVGKNIQEKTKDLRDIIETKDLILYTEKNLPDFYSKLYNQLKELSNKWNDSFIKFQDIIIDPTQNIDPRILQLANNLPAKSLVEQKNILIEIQDICSKLLTSNSHNAIWKIMRDLLVVIHFFEFHQKYAIEHLKIIVNNLEKYVSDIKTENKILSRMTLKNALLIK